MILGLLIAAITVLVAASAYMHLRGTSRFTIRRLLVEYSNWLAPYNALACAFARDRDPIQDLAQFPELAVLQENWRTIRDEAARLLDADLLQSSPRGDDLVFYSFFKRGWTRFYLRWYGEFYPSALRACPRTVELLAGIPNVRGAMIAAMTPRSRLGRHRDPFSGTLRYHLGLITPNSEKCRVYIDDHLRVWRDGEAILFDSTYLHKAKNETDQWRVVLFCDVERPMRHRVAAVINRFVVGKVLSATQTPNVPGDPIGWANRLFAAVQPIRHGIAWTKNVCPPCYYALKYGLPLVAAAAVVAFAVT